MFVVVGWVIVVGMAALLATQVARRSGTSYVAALQALTPYLVAPALPIAVIAAMSRTWTLAGAATIVAVVLGALGWPLVFPAAQPAPMDGASPISVFHANLLYANRRAEDIPGAVGSVDADVLAFTEYTPKHAAILLASKLADEFPHRVEYPASRATGAAIWSRFELTEIDGPELSVTSIAALVASPQPVTVLVVHPLSPLVSISEWHDDLNALRTLRVDHDRRVMTIGDFNACHWHPPFRRLLAGGWRDAHQATRRGLSTSWPADQRLLPPYVGIDHALVNDGLVVTATRYIDVPGSDHRGFVVTVVAAADS